MKLNDYCIIAFTTMSVVNTAFTQPDSLQNASKVIQDIRDARDMLDRCHYNAQMRFKGFGEDTFDIRNFSISYQYNTDNPLYGYDWEIAEEVDSGYMYTWMVLPEALYVIFEGNKSMSQTNLPKYIDLGSYIEYIRTSFILVEMYSPFTNISPGKITVIDSNQCFYITRQMNDVATRQLVVSKDTYLPIQSISTIRDEEFDFVQITDIHFYFDDLYKLLPDSAFSPDHYVSSGYRLKYMEADDSWVQEEMTSFSSKKQELLLNYPFISDAGDTTFISASKAEYIVLDFWYSSCFPCLKAMPEINQLADAYADRGLQVIAINGFDMDIRANVASKLRAKNITIPLLFSSRDLINTLGIRGFPTYCLITPDHKIEIIHGHVDDLKKVLEDLFEE